jgi:hypothetical protein
MKKKGLVFSVSLVVLLVLTSVSAQAQCCYNPFFFPFAVAGAIVGTAAAITTAAIPVPVYGYPAYPGAYYAPAPAYYGYGYGRGYYGRGYGPRPFYHRPVWTGDRHPRYGAWDGGHRR